MPRPRKPSWCVPGPGRPGRFRTFIDGKAYYFPTTIGRDDRPQVAGIPKAAWDYLAGLERAERDAAAEIAAPTTHRLCDAYLEWAMAERDAGRISPGHWGQLAWRLKVFVAHPGIADTKAEALDADRAADFFAAVSEKYSRHYAAGIGRTVRAAFRWAARPIPGREPTRLIAANPLDGYQFPRAPGAVRGYVEGEVVRRFLRWAWARGRGHAPGSSLRRFDRLFVLMLRFMRLTGCRPGEACGLLWEDVRWGEGKIVIPVERAKGAVRTGRARVIYLTPPVERLLRVIEGLPGRHVNSVFTHRHWREDEAGDAATRIAGEPWSDSTVAGAKLRRWRKGAIAAGVKGVEKIGPTKMVAYVNRHGYASAAISLGLTHEQAAGLLGNSAAVVRSTYAHAVEAADAERARKLMERGRSGSK